MKKPLLITLFVVLVLLIAGAMAFAGNKEASAPDKPAANKTTPEGGTGQTSEQASDLPLEDDEQASDSPLTTTDVAMTNNTYSPATVTIKKGTAISWTNKDSAAHNVVAMSGSTGPKSGTLAKGEVYTYTFETAGTYKYECTFHPGMIGTVIVTE